METTEFSGAPEGDDRRPDGADTGAGFGFFSAGEAAPAPTVTDEASVNEESPADQLLVEAALEPASEPAVEPEAPAAFDPGTLDGGSLLAPEAAPPAEATAGLPMSLAIAAEEAATVDVDAEPEAPPSFDYQAFH
ncbi:MAG TPA: hypothetical protein VFX15_10950, partial [Actinomycetes bacterium]|nr:hypothetical protein [Actinomycetes bacterium]